MNRSERVVLKHRHELAKVAKSSDLHMSDAGGCALTRAHRCKKGLRLTPLYASLLLIGVGASSYQVRAQTINLTSASPSYALSGNQTVTGITVANGVSGTITGPSYTLTYSGATSPFVVGGTTSASAQTLNMSGLTNFVFDNPTQNVSVGGQVNGGGGTAVTSGTLVLASGNNTITASTFGVADVPRNASAITTANQGLLQLGQSNIINAGTITIGTNQATGTVQFQSGITGGTLVLRGTDGTSPVANWNIGANLGNNYTSGGGIVNLTGGSLDALVTNLLIGQTVNTFSYGGSTSLTIGAGTLNATSITLGQHIGATSTATLNATLAINGATVTAQTLIMGDNQNSGATSRVSTTVNLNGGALLAQTIQAGAGIATRTFNWNGGTLGNYASGDNMTVSIPTITLGVSGNQAFDVEGASATATVSSVLGGAGGFTKTGAGLLALTGTNTYTGGTTVTNGLINFASPSNLGNGTITLNGGGLQWATGNTADISARLAPLGANGAIFDTNGNSVIVKTALTGGGALIKDGAGALTLFADNTYTGGTIINNGTLEVGAGNVTGSIVGNVSIGANSTLQFDQANNTTFDGVISGSGALNKIGNNTLTLTGDSTAFAGTTTISAAGTLQLGNGGTTGNIAGAIVDNSNLAIDHSNNVTITGQISGSGGTLSQIGTGTTILAADNTYTGGTTISAGTLQLGNGGTTGSVLGSIIDNGTLAIDRSDTVTFNNFVRGTGSLTQAGTGTTIITLDLPYTGGTTISAGTLQLGNGGTTGSIVGDVTDNATLAFDRTDSATFAGTISGSGALNQIGSGTTILIGDNTYSGVTTISAGVLQLGNGGTTGSIAGPVVDNTSLVIDNSGTVTLPGVISGSGVLNQIGSGTTILTGDNTYSGVTTISAGTLQLGNGGTTGSVTGDITDNGTLAFNRSDNIVYSNIISGTGGLNQLGPGTLQLNGAQTYTGPTNVLAGTLAVDGSIQSDTVTVSPGATLSGFGTIGADVYNQGTVWPGNAIVGDTNYGTLTIHGNYIGQGGVLALNTYLGGDGSPSDVLAIDGGAVTGTTGVMVHNTAPSSGETSGNGILVVSAINGATTTTDAFNLLNEARSGALDYRLFRGSVDGANPDSWYLRNEFTVPPEPPELPGPPVPPPVVLPPDPPPEPELPPGVYPIIGPEVATYGVVQPVARELGMLTLGTMDQRIGDSALIASSSAATDHGPSAWGRLFATNINNSYRAFAAPQANGNLYGFQTGADVWQGEFFPEHTDRFGGYVSYGQADISVRGLVTNAEATNYAMQHTGSLTLRATSFGAYWTHYGPGGWYLDGVMQASTYNGAATTQNARLNTNGTGFMGSLEFGYPFALPQLGTSFVLEPQVQAIWQHTAFSNNNDGLGEVALGSTNGSTGRIGVRGKWQLTSGNGQLWEPYVAANVWRDWGGRSATVFGDSAGSTSAAPLVPQASRAELDGGITGKLSKRLSAYASVGYEHELGSSTNAKREGFNADVGVRYTW